jgi:hypothetical protein
MGNKRIESAHFKAFRKLVPDFPDGEVWHEDKPDFRVHTESGILGIEHRLIHMPSDKRIKLQAAESQQDEIISIAQEHSELRGDPAILATIHFKLNFVTINEKERISLARSIARIIHDALEKNSSRYHFKISQPGLPSQLRSISIYPLKEESKHFWRCSRSGWVVEDCKELLQDVINKKAKLFPEYMKNCNECWLFLVAQLNPSSFIKPNHATIENKYVSPFSRTYFFELALRRLYLLNMQ